MRKNGTKNLRVNGEVARELSAIIRELKDPRIGVMTSVMEAVVATDLKTCKVYISVFGDEETREETMRGIESQRLNMRNTPELTYILDRSIERGAEMSRLIQEVVRHDEESHHEELE